MLYSPLKDQLRSLRDISQPPLVDQVPSECLSVSGKGSVGGKRPDNSVPAIGDPVVVASVVSLTCNPEEVASDGASASSQLPNSDLLPNDPSQTVPQLFWL